MKYFFLFIFSLFLFFDLKGDELIKEETNSEGFSAKISLSTNKLTNLDTLRCNILLTFPPGYEPNIAQLKSNLLKASGFNLPPFRIESELITDSEQANSLLTKKIQMFLTPQVGGTYYLSLQNISFDSVNKKQKTIQLISPIFEITVSQTENVSVLPPLSAPLLSLSPMVQMNISRENRKEIYHNKETLEKVYAENYAILQEKKIPWFGLLILALGAYMIYKILTAPPSNQKVKVTSLQLAFTAKDKADEALNIIRKESSPKKELFDLFYINLTDAVRFYIEDKYKLNAPNLTTQEFLGGFRNNSPFNEKTKTHLSQFLEISDRVKFSPYLPSIKECELAEVTAKEILQNT
jgi:hypothetical protein